MSLHQSANTQFFCLWCTVLAAIELLFEQTVNVMLIPLSLLRE